MVWLRFLFAAVLFFTGLALGAPTEPARALRRARPYRLEPVVALPAVLPRDGALVVTNRPATRDGLNRDPSRVRVLDPAGEPVRLRAEELAPDLVRLAPRGRFAAGSHSVSGLGDVRTLRVGRGAPVALAAPSVASITNTRRPVVAAEPNGAMLERVVVELRDVPAEARVLVAHWVDWHDSEGGLYGAWTRLAGAAGSVPLICTAEHECGDVHGHIPRENERGELRYLDASGRLSPPTTVVVTTAH